MAKPRGMQHVTTTYEAFIALRAGTARPLALQIWWLPGFHLAAAAALLQIRRWHGIGDPQD